MSFRSGAKNIAVTALMSALLIAGKFALSFIPNVEVVTLLVMLFSAVFGFFRTIPAVLVFCAIDNIIYPPSLDVTIQYFFHWSLLCVVSALVGRRTKNEFVFLAIASVASVLFWLETPAIGSLLGFYLFVPSMISGSLFFAVNLISNGAIALVLFKPLCGVLSKIKGRLFASPPSD